MNTLKLIGELLAKYLVPLLFLLGLIIINIASYIGFGVVIGLYVTGITLVVLSLILVTEKSRAIPPQQ